MAQSLAKNLIHLIFSTKNREPILSEIVRPNLHRYMAGIFKDLESPTLAVNSYETQKITARSIKPINRAYGT